jgi:hypothetical protein
MQLPLTDADTLFEELLQDLPPETEQMARNFKAFVRAKKVKTPTQLLRMVLLYCGLDKTLREIAGTWTALYEPGAFGDSYASRRRRRYRSNTRSNVPLYLAQRSANISLLLASYHQAPERLRRT